MVIILMSKNQKKRVIILSEIIIRSSAPLCGCVEAAGSKNGALPVLAATILSNGTTAIDRLPDLTDVHIIRQMLDNIGAQQSNNEFYYPCIRSCQLDEQLSQKMRGSFLLAGPLLARTGHVRIGMPGGCRIGARPIDLHLKGFYEMGAQIEAQHGFIEITASKLHGAQIYLDFPSVGATENIMMAATLADGQTMIENASAEPEIVELASFLCAMGARIKGAGSDRIIIDGVQELHGARHTVIADRIEAGTYLLAFAVTHGKGTVLRVYPQHLTPVIAKLREMGAIITEMDDTITIDASSTLRASDIKTMPFPGFPTDMQSQFTTLLSLAEGTSIVIETVFENRFLHIGALNRMGANIKIDGRTAVVEGGHTLTGASVEGADLRGSAALVLAGLAAKGETRVSGTEHLQRGYDNLVGKLQKIGACLENI